MNELTLIKLAHEAFECEHDSLCLSVLANVGRIAESLLALDAKGQKIALASLSKRADRVVTA